MMLVVTDVETAIDVLIAGNAHADNEVRSNRIANCRRDLEQQAQAAIETAAIGIAPPVRIGRQECRKQQAECSLNLHAVESARLDPHCRLAEAFDHLGDFGDSHFMWNLPQQFRGNRGWCPERQARFMARRSGAIMGQLGEDGSPFGMNGIGEGTVGRDDAVIDIDVT